MSNDSSHLDIGDKTAFFNEDVHPEDMDFNIVRVGKGGLDQKYYSNLLTAVSSHNNEQNIPGRN